MAGHMHAEELQRYLFQDSQDRLPTQVGVWLAASPRFRAFVEAHRDKIRKKARVMGEEEAQYDLLVELWAAYWLSRDKRFTLVYEPFTAHRTRGPDYVVTYTTKFTFTVEVTRLRAACHFARWADIICAKLLQLPPSQPNVVLVATRMGQCTDFDFAQQMKDLRALAEHKEDAFFAQRGWRDARDFMRQLLRLSAVLWVDGWDAPTGGVRTLWLNAQVKHPLPHEARSVLIH